MPPDQVLVDLDFPHGLLGLTDLRRFRLEPLLEASPFMRLVSLDEPDLEFLVMAGEVVRAGLTEALAAAIGARGIDHALILVLVSIESDGAISVNLAGPLVVDTRTREAVQIVVDDPDFPLRAPLPETF